MTTIDATVNATKSTNNDTENAIKGFLTKLTEGVAKVGYELIQYGPRAAVDIADVFLYFTSIIALAVGVIVLAQNSALFAALLLLAVTIKLLHAVISA